MEIESLCLWVTEDDLNTIADEATARDKKLRNVRVRVEESGITVTGEYKQLFIALPFEIRFQAGIRDGLVAIQLLQLKAAGLPASMLKGAVLNAVRAEAGDAARIEGEDLLIDVDRLLLEKRVPLTTNLRSIQYQLGKICVKCQL